MRDLLLWFIAIEFFAIASLPLAFQLFRMNLSILPWALKTFGLITPALLIWVMSLLTGLPIDRLTLAAVFVIYAGPGWWIFARSAHFQLFRAWFASSGKEILRAELAFLFAFAVAVLLRLKAPDLIGTEKPMEEALFASLLRATSLPAEDPWFAGSPIPYYAFGYFVFSIPAKLVGVPLSYAFNLALASVSALAVTTAYGASRLLRPGRWPGLISVWLLGLAGNLRGLQPNPGFLWQSTRIIHDRDPVSGASTEMIHEYPLFSHLLGDLHPHFMAMTTWTLLLSVWISQWASRETLTLLQGILIGSLFGAGAILNPWDFPALTLLLGFLLFHKSRSSQENRPGILASAAAFILPLVLFKLGGSPPVAGIAFFRGASGLEEATLAYAPLLLLAIAGLGPRIRSIPFRVFLPVLLASFSIAALKGGFPALLFFLFASLLATRSGKASVFLSALSLFLLSVPEWAFVQDAFGNRMNTVFKFSFAAWLIGGIALPVLVAEAFENGGKTKRAFLQASTAVFIFLTASAPYFSIRERLSSPGFVLDGWQGLLMNSPHWVEAAAWLSANAKPGDRILESPSDSYSSDVLLSTMTGVPSYLGWKGHEMQWRGWNEELRNRAQAVSDAYGSADPLITLQLMNREKIRFLILRGNDPRWPAGPPRGFTPGFNSSTVKIYFAGEDG